MMEEVTITMASHAHFLDEMSEEEILACLVDESQSKHTATPSLQAPPKKARLRDSQRKDDAIDTCLRENHRLQQASLRLEQENDSLAHRLVTSKISLRTALDQAEDRVDDLTKDLFLTRQRLQVAEEEKRGKVEEAAMLKEVFRKELEKAELEVKRSSGIVADYKQICSQLTGRLERQQAAHGEELDAIQSVVQACSCCRRLLESEGRLSSGLEEGSASTEPAPDVSGTTGPDRRSSWAWDPEQDSMGTREADQERNQRRMEREKEDLSVQVRQLQRELAQTKLQMVEAKCTIQDLEHQRGVLTTDLQAAKNNWFNKTLTTLRSAGGGLQGPGTGGPAAGWTLHKGPLSSWGSRRSLRSDI